MTDAHPAPPRLPSFDSPAVKLGLALVLILILQVPLLAVSSMVDERQDRQEQVVAGIRRSWGPSQAVTAPTLDIPVTWVQAGTPSTIEHGWIQVPARQATIAAVLAPETRQRGLFHATVYAAAVDVGATLAVPKIDLTSPDHPQLDWPNAVVAVGATDMRGQPAGGTMEVNGHPAPLTVQRSSDQCTGIASVPAGFTGPPAPGTELTVKTHLDLRGTQSFAAVPWGQAIDMQVSAPWQTPSFTGGGLPLDYTIGRDGFRANWQILGDAAASTWRRAGGILPGCSTSDDDTQVSVALLEAVPTYLMVTRAAKYGTLFLVLSFLTYFLIEQATGLRIHLAQYALLGLSVSLFALLLVSLAEPLGFTIGYVLSTVAVMAQASLYTLSITHRPRLASVLAIVLAALFGVLYVVLRLESYALLAGTATLFVILSVIMVATRHLDWSGRTAMGLRP